MLRKWEDCYTGELLERRTAKGQGTRKAIEKLVHAEMIRHHSTDTVSERSPNCVSKGTGPVCDWLQAPLVALHFSKLQSGLEVGEDFTHPNVSRTCKEI